MAAALLCSFILVSVELCVFFLLYSSNHTTMFLDSSVNSFINDRVFWFDLSFIQYIALTVVSLYILALVVTLLVMLVSSYVSNTLALIGLQVLTAFFAIRYMLKYLIDYIGDVRFTAFVQPLAFVLLITAVVGLTVLRRWQEKRCDIK